MIKYLLPAVIAVCLPAFSEADTTACDTSVVVKEKDSTKSAIGVTGDPAGAGVFWDTQTAGTTPAQILYYITSDPYGASVRYRDSVLGTTPLRFSADDSAGTVSVLKEGYKSVDLPLSRQKGGIHATLTPAHTIQFPSRHLFLRDGTEEKSVPIYAAAGTAVIGGAASAFFKIKADALYKDYRKSGSTATLNRVRNLDLASGISLAVTEISIFILYYLLLSR